MTTPKLFITGATGYIGGDFLYAIYDAQPTWHIAVLVRHNAGAENIARIFPRVRIVRGDLESSTVLCNEVRDADIVLHFANCDHEGSAQALLKGLARHSSERPGWYIHTSGTGILAFEDKRSQTCGILRGRVYNDWEGVSELVNLPSDAFHRNVDSLVTQTYHTPEKTFKTAIVCPCCIYGTGRGPGNTSSTQVYTLATTVLKRGKGIRVGEGRNVWHQVHIQDLTKLYVLLVEAAASGGGNATWDEEGYYLAENGSFCWGDVEEAVSRVAFERGYIPTSQIDTLDWSRTESLDARGPYRWGSNSRGTAVRARRLLGWVPNQLGLLETIDEIVDCQACVAGLLKSEQT
ncbi:NAD(P)-binding protein [Aaosphaeria arxii CBS 175.79]|uniref:NAD(P)-binding protein n=1 Tax=Aaosphaeria arxii CBS 175.79 TaxID=1450172 RepID=A0A6A5XL27_9PLEO|nr:NAD(P)-binding protein [Aaosphaeria arxii CBS 175.79]KAF2013004.1 NAD(P)-binding protein [Aaosphaeria arxii CBS 175.79]